MDLHLADPGVENAVQMIFLLSVNLRDGPDRRNETKKPRSRADGTAGAVIACLFQSMKKAFNTCVVLKAFRKPSKASPP